MALKRLVTVMLVGTLGLGLCTVSDDEDRLSAIGRQDADCEMSDSEHAPVDGGDPALLAQADTAFGLDLYRCLATGSDNIFFSPYSAAVALTMAHAGARGETASEMASVLRLPFDGDRLHSARAELEQHLETDPEAPIPGLEIQSANALWGQRGYPFREEFVALIDATYGDGGALIDFARDARGARAAINAWADRETRGRIRQIVSEQSVTEATRLVITNAVYFKGRWVRTFDTRATELAPFQFLDGTREKVPMMHTTAIYRYGRHEDYRAIRLPYFGGASMLVIVPDQGSFGEVEERMSADFLRRVDAGLSGHEVDFKFPRFEFDWEATLVPALRSLGMVRPFTPPDQPDGADLTGMADIKELFLNAVAHKAYVGVDELGTEAAAVTAVGVMAVSKPVAPPARLVVDRPFLFAIQDGDTGALLFLGRVLDPTR